MLINTNGTFIKTLSWETFEKGVGIVPSNRIVEDAKELLLQDAVLVPCNEPKCEHWTLLAVLPKKKLVMYLDSLDNNNNKISLQDWRQSLLSLLDCCPLLGCDVCGIATGCCCFSFSDSTTDLGLLGLVSITSSAKMSTNVRP